MVEVFKVPGTLNPADLMTKFLGRSDIRSDLGRLRIRAEERGKRVLADGEVLSADLGSGKIRTARVVRIGDAHADKALSFGGGGLCARRA